MNYQRHRLTHLPSIKVVAPTKAKPHPVNSIQKRERSNLENDRSIAFHLRSSVSSADKTLLELSSNSLVIQRERESTSLVIHRDPSATFRTLLATAELRSG